MMMQVNGGEKCMPMITVNIALTKTVATLDATTITAILTWIQTNIKDKLPADTTLNITFNINP
jgi:hypothetical protein